MAKDQPKKDMPYGNKQNPARMPVQDVPKRTNDY